MAQQTWSQYLTIPRSHVPSQCPLFPAQSRAQTGSAISDQWMHRYVNEIPASTCASWVACSRCPPSLCKAAVRPACGPCTHQRERGGRGPAELPTRRHSPDMVNEPGLVRNTKRKESGDQDKESSCPGGKGAGGGVCTRARVKNQEREDPQQPLSSPQHPSEARREHTRPGGKMLESSGQLSATASTPWPRQQGLAGACDFETREKGLVFTPSQPSLRPRDTYHFLPLLSLQNIRANKVSLGFNKSPCRPGGIKRKEKRLWVALSICYHRFHRARTQLWAGKAFRPLFKWGGSGEGKGKKRAGGCQLEKHWPLLRDAMPIS